MDDRNFSLPGSEIIVKYIIDKLISYAITNSNKNEIEKKIGLHCFKFLRSMLKEMILMDNLCFEREDYKINQNKLKEKEPIFFDNVLSSYNDWSEIAEPVSFYFKIII